MHACINYYALHTRIIFKPMHLQQEVQCHVNSEFWTRNLAVLLSSNQWHGGLSAVCWCCSICKILKLIIASCMGPRSIGTWQYFYISSNQWHGGLSAVCWCSSICKILKLIIASCMGPRSININIVRQNLVSLIKHVIFIW